jgi:hypothetical protein
MASDGKEVIIRHSLDGSGWERCAWMGVCIAMISVDVCLNLVGQGNIYQGERSPSGVTTLKRSGRLPHGRIAKRSDAERQSKRNEQTSMRVS